MGREVCCIMKYRKKPVVIEAIQWNGLNWDELVEFGCQCAQDQDDKILIPTLEGILYANVGDYIIKGVAGEFYPCKPSIFEATYEKTEGISKTVVTLDVDEIVKRFSEKLEEVMKEVAQ